MFYSLEKSEDISLGYNISDNWENVPKRQGGRKRGQRVLRTYRRLFLQQKTRKSAHQKVTVNIKYLAKKKKKDFKRNLGPCYVGEDASVWAHWSHSFAMHLSCLDQSTVTSHAISLRDHLWGDYRLITTRAVLFPPSWVPLRLTVQAPVMRWLDVHSILCLLTWQARF